MPQRIADILQTIRHSGAFAAKRSCPASALRIEVKGVGPIRLPVSARTAARLRTVARPARYGLKDQTLLNPQVRNTWEIARNRIRIDQRKWRAALQSALERLRGDLGLPEGIELKAELHDMLLYEKGQFFQKHQDSEKWDDMLGTLVVALPSRFAGGASVVEHGGERLITRGSTRDLQLVAFYADCRHEVRPVTDGHRVVLTYNLFAQGEPDVTAALPEGKVDALALAAGEYFDTPIPHRWADRPAQPPDRLVYLLDHEYTAKGLGWNRLKNADSLRVAALREVAAQLDCEIFLALADVQETWDCEPEYDPWQERRWRRHDFDDELYDDDEPGGGHTLLSLIDQSIELRHWFGLGAARPAAVSSFVDDKELCYSTPSDEMKPFRTDYTGYMGNWGNTEDRWYHRAAVVLWPRDRSFVILAKASPATAIAELASLVKRGLLDEARDGVEKLRPFWKDTSPSGWKPGVTDRTLRIAVKLQSPELAELLLTPLTIEQLGTRAASHCRALVETYGLDWARQRFAEWLESDRRRRSDEDRFAWFETLPRFSGALAGGPEHTRSLARWLLEELWSWLEKKHDAARGALPRARVEPPTHIVRSTVALLQSTRMVESPDLRGRILAALTSRDDEFGVSVLIRILRAAHSEYGPAGLSELGLGDALAHCTRRLEEWTRLPERAADDWRISVRLRCACTLCTILGEFLASPRPSFEWPLAKEARRHVHSQIDLHDLPVAHTTARTGRPFRLVLRKTEALFAREASRRESWLTDIAWLRAT
jgi:predicted 2-oxoglutarate/Fe(II)-dependent dioxygenase YbiX